MNKLTVEQYQEARDLLQEAQERMQDAIQALKSYVALTDDRHTKAYLVDHLECMASSNHSFLSREANIDTVLESLAQSQEDWEMEEEEEDMEAWEREMDAEEEAGSSPLPRYHDDVM